MPHSFHPQLIAETLRCCCRRRCRLAATIEKANSRVAADHVNKQQDKHCGYIIHGETFGRASVSNLTFYSYLTLSSLKVCGNYAFSQESYALSNKNDAV